MKVEDFRMSNLGQKKVVNMIESQKCTLFLICGNKFGDFIVESYDDVSICGTFTRGRCISYDGLPTIPLYEIDKSEAYYICCEKDSKELYEALKNWVKTNEFKKWLDE